MKRAWAGWPTRRGAALLAVLVLVAVTLVGGLLRVRVDTGTESFLPAGDPTLAAVRQKATDFGGDPVIVLLRYPRPHQFVADRAQLFALLKAEGELAKLPDVATVYGPATVLNQLAGAAQNFLAQIAGRRDALRKVAEQAARQAGSPEPAVSAAGDAAVAQFDLRYAPLVVRGLPVGLPTLNNQRFAQTVLFGADGQAKPEWRFIVPTPDTVAILVRPRQDLDQAGTQRLVSAIRATVAAAGLATSGVTISGVPAVTAALSGEIGREAGLLGLLVAVVVLVRFLLVPVPGAVRWWQRLRPLLASLLGSAATLALFGWLGWPLSLGVVALLPLLLGVGSSFPLYLASVPNRRRVLVMSVASAAAFLTLALSPLPFVRDLGLALGAGIMLTVGATLLLNRRWGASARPCGDRDPSAEAPELAPPAQGLEAARAPGSVSPSARLVEAAQSARPVRPGRGRRMARLGALVAAVALALLGWSVLPRITVAANPVDLARGLPALDDAREVESVLGASGEIGVALAGPDVLSPAALAWGRAARDALTSRLGDQLRPVVSAPSLLGFLGPSPTADQVKAAVELLPPYLSSSVVRPDRGVSLLLFGVGLRDLGAQQRMLADLRAALPAPPDGYRVDIVGLPVAAVRGYQLLLDDRYLANLAGIAAAGLVLAIGLRRRRDAGRAVLASVLATGWGLAALWVLGMALSPMTVALGSLVGVTGCEFVVLLAAARDRRLRLGVGYACLTSVLGYLVLAASRLWLVREFGLVLGAAVLLSYLAARLVIWLGVPARLIGRGATATAPANRAVGVEVNA